MLEKLIIKNFRCYDEHEVNFKELTVVVGKNNAGKSTLIEALRLVALASNRFKTSVFHSPPPWTELPLISKGIKPSLKHLDINFLNIFNGYGSQPSIIVAKYNDNTTIHIYVGNDLEFFLHAYR